MQFYWREISTHYFIGREYVHNVTHYFIGDKMYRGCINVLGFDCMQ